MSAEHFVHNVSADHENTEKDHFYPTPPEATKALLAIEKLDNQIWEPSCGKGDMSRILEAAGHTVDSSDLVDRGFGEPRIDFLLERKLRAPTIVTNPPFRLAEKFLHHALDIGAEKVCLLLRLAWLEGDGRKKRVYDVVPPVRVWVSSRRITMIRPDWKPKPGKEDEEPGGMIAFAWFVWERGFAGPYPELRMFDWMDFAPEHAKEKKPRRQAAEPMSLFA